MFFKNIIIIHKTRYSHSMSFRLSITLKPNNERKILYCLKLQYIINVYFKAAFFHVFEIKRLSIS